MQANALRRLAPSSGAQGAGAADQHYAQQLSGLDLGVLDLKLSLNAGQRDMLTQSNVYDALSQSTRNIIASMGRG